MAEDHPKGCGRGKRAATTATRWMLNRDPRQEEAHHWTWKAEIKMSDDGVYRVKKVRIGGKDVAVVLQNENGPCPLLAIANVLLLREELNLEPQTVNLSHERLVSMVAGNLLDRYKGEQDENVRQNVHDAISVLPEIAKGLDVNVRFRQVKDFEYTKESAIFDLFGIDLVHGWLVDKGDMPLYEYIGSKSYNQLVEEIIASGIHDDGGGGELEGSAAKQSETSTSCPNEDPIECKLSCLQEDDPTCNTSSVSFHVDSDDRVKVGIQTVPKGIVVHLHERGDEPVGKATSSMRDEKLHSDLERAYAIDDFLKSSSQLTYSGLIQLHEKVEADQYAVFFRNNHFSTITKHEKSLYILVTDQGYENSARVVWEVLGEVDGDSQLMTGDFVVWEAQADGAEDGPRAGMVDADESADFALAIALQEEENERIQAIATAESESSAPHGTQSVPGDRDGVGGEGSNLPVSTPASATDAPRRRLRDGRASREKGKCVLM